MSTYNGWTNYATWRINLEIFDGVEPADLGCFTRYEEPDTSDVARYLEDYVDEVLCTYASGGPCGEGVTLDYARAFVAQVNWYEIAEHFCEQWRDQMAEEERERDEEEQDE
jgi:hypothetical protein